MSTPVQRASLLTIIALGLAAAGCDKPKPVEDEPATAAATTGAAATGAATATGSGDPTAKAKEIFGTRCTPCHGPAGAGDGPASASLDPHPRNFTDKAWQQSVTDDHIEKIIKFGGAAVGKSPAMPGNPDLTDPAVIAALRATIRGFGS